MKKPLVAYFSATGTTAKVAARLAEALGADLREIRPETPYTASDLNWRDAHSRSTRERDPAARPAIAGAPADLTPYDTVFLGFPIWWYEAPAIIRTFLTSCDLAGRTVVPFATSGGSGLGDTEKILRALCPDTVRWKPGRLLSARVTTDELRRWAEQLDL